VQFAFQARGRVPSGSRSGLSARGAEGWRGWDEYADFYDWENARTLGRRDVQFWATLARREKGRVLELGCGTGRLLKPLARVARVVGVDRSDSMLARARERLAGLKPGARARLVRGDIRALPFAAASFAAVIAPYGMLQSLVSDRDLRDALASAARVLAPGGLFGVDLVPDLPHWREYGSRRRLSGRAADGSRVTLIESVEQDRRRGVTVFHERFLARRGSTRQVREFSLTFRTLPVEVMVTRIERAGFQVESLLGDYRGRPWDPRAETWIVLARRTE